MTALIGKRGEMLSKVELVDESTRARAKTFAFVLLPGFSALSLYSALETLGAANDVANSAPLNWTICSETGSPVASSLKCSHQVDSNLSAVKSADYILVCAGSNVEKSFSKKLLHWLRFQARCGASVGGLEAGSYVLAKAGLLNGKTASINCEYRTTFSELFPEVDLAAEACVAAGQFPSAAGGTSSIDLVLEIICPSSGILGQMAA